MDGNVHLESHGTKSTEQATKSSPASSAGKLVIKSILSGYWRDDDPQVQAVEMAHWQSVLTGIDPAELFAAWDRYEAEGPRSSSGRLAKPTPHDIRQRAMRIRYERAGCPTPQPGFTSRVDAQRLLEDKSREKEPRADKWTADQIVKEYGFDPRRTQILERFPRARSIEEAEHLAEEKKRKEPHWSEVAAPDDPRWASLQKARDDNEIVKAARADYAMMLKAKEDER